ncbi:F0F1 ATP synthase subunit delta [Microbacterium pseudoresistens]|uniref:ATP synthase subunit delta n=1 Tax=Microbacterium pseudoresistens TaxID=640634 RepID=A0A7Y9EW53_9MICO|nr:F0F1 ATP synthase subunit delta [Microbacterium pseudoresistens]NYD55063.1 F-type H+-transporting ATPase subunit delta [Microbacterium pseudoresistens]
MGSATTQALAASTTALTATSGLTLDSARELFAAARQVGESAGLSGALADPSAPAAAREALVARVFAGFSAPVQRLLAAVAAERWSSPDDLVDGIEELAVRSAAVGAAEEDIEGQLFSVSRLVADNSELELALGSRLGDATAKGALIEKLLTGAAGAATTLIVSSLVQQPRERRVRQLLSRAMRIVSAQRDRIVATVHSAAALSEAQRTRLSELLATRYGRPVALNVVLDPAVVGGLRVQVADDVIDGSISARLADLRQKLAG